MTTLPLLSLVALPFVGSLLAAFLPANARNAESTLAGLIALFCAVQAALYFPEVAAGGVIRQEFNWLPSLGLNFVLRMDGYAWMFSMLVLGIGALVMLYARYYMSPADPVPRFFSFLLAFMGAMSGVVLSGNLIQIVLFWELTSLFSFLLIGYWHHRRDARRGARMALTVTGAGGLCLLAGMLVLGHIVGSYDLDVVLASGVQVRTHPLYTVMLVLVLLGALTKSAQFPFHFWLPQAMAAPTPVSAYLHSATMVKAGVFLLARLWPVLAGTDEWFWLVTSSGLITLLIGGFAAIFQHDLKSLLAYSTLSHLGLITTLLGLNSPLAAVAAVFHILNHATFKASLFMAVGIIDHETGTRDIRRLSGLWRAMPITGTLACVASAAMAGVPLLNGFISKEMFFTEAVFVTATPMFERLLPIVATVAGMFSVVYSLRFTADVFFGRNTSHTLPKPPHEPPHWMRVPIEVLVLACLLVGVAPQWAVQDILNAAATPVVGGHLPAFDLAVWHGFNLPLMMSFVALVGGIVLYLLLHRPMEHGHLQRTPLLSKIRSKQIFQGVLAWLTALSRRTLQKLLERAAAHQHIDYIRLTRFEHNAMPVYITGRKGWPGDLDAVVSFYLQMDDEEYGRLDMISAHPIDERLMKNFSMLLAQVLHKDQTLLQHQRLLLMEERAVIARELHDSLAQALSYLKIQSTLLKRSVAKGDNGKAKAAMEQIDEGLSNAYTQLRELLGTFRLSIGDANLGEAIGVMLEQLKPQTRAEIRLQYGLTDTDLEAGQHIHILQLIREAVLNAIKHACAQRIDVSCETLADGNIQVQIADDGVGIGGASSAVNHYGLSIMNERASKLHGQLTISEPSSGGTRVHLTFPTSLTRDA